MFIDQIKIEGFKTFGNAVTLGPFFPGINLLVGYNGSGKTSILDAINFVLDVNNDDLTKKQFNELNCLETKEEKNFINIEIIIDNSDKKYDEYPSKLSIIRRATLTTNNYIINKKKLTKTKYINIIKQLEINVSTLKQGSVIQFAKLTDLNRLDLLFTMIGYQKIDKSYQDKWIASIKKRKELLIDIRKCYDRLEAEYNLCEEFRKILKKKEYITYGMDKIRMIEAKNKIEQIEKKFRDWSEVQSNKTPKYMQLKSQLDMIESELMEANNSLQSLETTKQQITDRLAELETQKGKLQASILGSQKSDEEREQLLKEMRKELESLEKEIKLEEDDIQSLKSELSSVTINIRKLEIKYGEQLCELDSLRSKLSIDDMPVNEEERKESLRKSIQAYQASIAEKQEYLKKHQHERQEKNNKIQVLKEKIMLIKAELDNIKILQQSDSKEWENYNKKIKIVTDLLRKISADKAEISEKLKLLQNNYKQNYKKLLSATKCDVMYNKNAIEDILKSLNSTATDNEINNSRYHGFVIDCFQYHNDIEAAVLAVIGKKLFHFVFNYGKDANTVVKKINDIYNLSIISLDLLTFPTKKLPNFNDAIPLITQITSDLIYDKLMKYLFCNILLCKNNKVALNYAKKYKITCVTSQGSVFYSDGFSETGNWNENERNQMKIYRSMINQQLEINNNNNEINILNDKELSLKNNLSEIIEKINIIELQKDNNDKRKLVLESKLDVLEFQLLNITIDDDNNDEIINFIKTLTDRIKILELKLNNNDDEQMTSQEYQRYKELELSIENLLKLQKDDEKKAVELNNKITNKLNILEEIYLKRKNDLQREIQETMMVRVRETNKMKDNIIDLQYKLKLLAAEYRKLEELDTEIDKLQIKIDEKMKIKKEKNDKAEVLKCIIEANDVEIKNLRAECDDYKKIIDETQRKINNIPKVVFKNPDPELKNIEALTLHQLSAFQVTVDNQLRRMTPDVNENATEMFSRMREALKKTQTAIKEFDDDKGEVEMLKGNFKTTSQAQVYDSLEDINEYLKYIVQKFITNAQVELILMTGDREYSVGEAQDDDVDVNDLVGISIKFAELKDGRVMKLNELSGGQNTILSLALILAIQKYFDVTIMLCDEIDQALDYPNRVVLNEIFKTIVAEGQIFLTTFRTELVEVGDHHYLVEKQASKKTSSIKVISKEEALKFLKSIKRGELF